jgi:hypothetical protein
VSQPDLIFLKPYLIDYVAAGVHAQLSGTTSTLEATLK